jgi:hypothetical protein
VLDQLICRRFPRVAAPWKCLISIKWLTGNCSANSLGYLIRSGPPLATEGRHLAQDLARRKVGLDMRVPASEPPRHAERWETIVRYALDSNARTIRLCLICVAMTCSLLLTAVVLSML